MAPGPGDTVEIGLSQGTALPPHKAGKEVRKGEVFYSWGKGAKHPVMYGFSSDQRWVGRSLGPRGRQ